MRDRRDKKRLSAFDDMRKTNWPSGWSKVLQFGSDEGRFCDQRQDFVVAGHAEVLMKLHSLQRLVLQRFCRGRGNGQMG